MAVYNCECYIDDAVASIVTQSYRHWELCIINDGSTDGTDRLLEKWAELGPRITIFHRECSGTAGASRNYGLTRIRGDIVANLDGDDVAHPERFARIMAIFTRYPHAGPCITTTSVSNPLPIFDEPAAQQASKYLKRALQFGALIPCGNDPGLYESTNRFRAFLASH